MIHKFKSKTLTIFSLSLVVLSNLSFAVNTANKNNHFFTKNHSNELSLDGVVDIDDTSHSYEVPDISKLTSSHSNKLSPNDVAGTDDMSHSYEEFGISMLIKKFPWLKKYANDENFINRGFNAYINENLIKKALYDQCYCYLASALFEFQKWILSTNPSLKYQYLCEVVDYQYGKKKWRNIVFDINCFKEWSEIKWGLFFDAEKLKFNTESFLNLDTKSVLPHDLVSYFFENEMHDGIFYVDENDKDNESNQINLDARKKIKQIKDAMDLDNCLEHYREKILIFSKSLKKNYFFSNDEIKDLILLLGQIVTINREFLNHTAIANKQNNQRIAQSVIINADRNEFANWLENHANIREFSDEVPPLLANNKFDDFFNYLYCYRSRYIHNGVIDFKGVITDFVPIARRNLTIITLEKAVSSYILAVLNNKKIINTFWNMDSVDYHLGKNGRSYMKIINWVVTELTIAYVGLVVRKLDWSIWPTPKRTALTTRSCIIGDFWKGVFDSVSDMDNFWKDFFENATSNFITGSSWLKPREIIETVIDATGNIVYHSAFRGLVNTAEHIRNDSDFVNYQTLPNNEIINQVETGRENIVLKPKESSGWQKNNIEEVDEESMNEEPITNVKKHEIMNEKDIDLDENKIKITNDKKNDDNKDKINEKFIKQWIIKKFGRENFYYYHEGGFDWIDIENDSSFINAIINYLKNFKNVKSRIKRIPLKDVLKAILDIIRNEDKNKKIYFSDVQLTKIIASCFKNDAEGKEKLKFDADDKKFATNKISAMLDGVKVKVRKNPMFDVDNEFYEFNVASLSKLQKKVEIIGFDDYIPYQDLILAFTEILRKSYEKYSCFSQNKLIYLVATILSEICEKNRKLNVEKDEFTIEKLKENEKEEKNVIREVQSNSNEDLISNKKENDNNSINTNEKLKTNITNKISTILNGVRVESQKNGIFKKNWNYVFNFASLPLLIQSKIKDIEKKENISYVSYDLFLEAIIKILKDDAQICSLIKNDELNFFVADNLNKMLEKNRKLNEGKNKFTIKKLKENEKEEESSESDEDKDNIRNVNKAEANDINDNELEEYVKNSVNELLNNAEYEIKRQKNVESDNDVVVHSFIGETLSNELQVISTNLHICSVLFIGETLSNELQDQIKKENERIRDFNAGRSSIEIDEIDSKKICCNALETLIIKLLSSKNKKIEDKIKQTMNFVFGESYHDKLLTTIEKIMSDLIKNNALPITNDRYKIVTMKHINNHSEGENDDGLVQEKKGEDNEPILPDRSNIIQNKENIPAYDNLISENGYNINNIAQNEEKREEENDINDNELEEYVKNSVNKLLNNARFTINRQIGFGMSEIGHDIIKYLFIGDSLSKELKDQIKKENESIRDFNAGRSSMKMDEIDVDTVDYDRVVSLIMKLLSSKNEEVSNKIKHNNNYRFKLLETIKNIVLKLIKNSRKLSDDTYKIVINENDYDFVQEKKGEENDKKPENSEFKKSHEHEYGYENGITNSSYDIGLDKIKEIIDHYLFSHCKVIINRHKNTSHIEYIIYYYDSLQDQTDYYKADDERLVHYVKMGCLDKIKNISDKQIDLTYYANDENIKNIIKEWYDKRLTLLAAQELVKDIKVAKVIKNFLNNYCKLTPNNRNIKCTKWLSDFTCRNNAAVLVRELINSHEFDLLQKDVNINFKDIASDVARKWIEEQEQFNQEKYEKNLKEFEKIVKNSLLSCKVVPRDLENIIECPKWWGFSTQELTIPNFCHDLSHNNDLIKLKEEMNMSNNNYNISIATIVNKWYQKEIDRLSDLKEPKNDANDLKKNIEGKIRDFLIFCEVVPTNRNKEGYYIRYKRESDDFGYFKNIEELFSKLIRYDEITQLRSEIKNLKRIGLNNDAPNKKKLKQNNAKLIPKYLFELWKNEWYNEQYLPWDEFIKQFDNEQWKNYEKNKPHIEKISKLLNCSTKDLNQQKIKILPEQIKKESIDFFNKAKNKIIAIILALLFDKKDNVLLSFDDLWNEFVENFNNNYWKNKDENAPLITSLSRILNCTSEELKREKIDALGKVMKETVDKIIEGNKKYVISFYLAHLFDEKCENLDSFDSSWIEFANKFNDNEWRLIERNKINISYLEMALPYYLNDKNFTHVDKETILALDGDIKEYVKNVVRKRNEENNLWNESFKIAKEIEIQRQKEELFDANFNDSVNEIINDWFKEQKDLNEIKKVEQKNKIIKTVKNYLKHCWVIPKIKGDNTNGNERKNERKYSILYETEWGNFRVLYDKDDMYYNVFTRNASFFNSKMIGNLKYEEFEQIVRETIDQWCSRNHQELKAKMNKQKNHKFYYRRYLDLNPVLPENIIHEVENEKEFSEDENSNGIDASNIENLQKQKSLDNEDVVDKEEERDNPDELSEIAEEVSPILNKVKKEELKDNKDVVDEEEEWKNNKPDEEPKIAEVSPKLNKLKKEEFDDVECIDSIFDNFKKGPLSFYEIETNDKHLYMVNSVGLPIDSWTLLLNKKNFTELTKSLDLADVKKFIIERQKMQGYITKQTFFQLIKWKIENDEKLSTAFSKWKDDDIYKFIEECFKNKKRAKTVKIACNDIGKWLKEEIKYWMLCKYKIVPNYKYMLGGENGYLILDEDSKLLSVDDVVQQIFDAKKKLSDIISAKDLQLIVDDIFQNARCTKKLKNTFNDFFRMVESWLQSMHVIWKNIDNKDCQILVETEDYSHYIVEKSSILHSKMKKQAEYQDIVEQLGLNEKQINWIFETINNVWFNKNRDSLVKQTFRFNEQITKDIKTIFNDFKLKYYYSGNDYTWEIVNIYSDSTTDHYNVEECSNLFDGIVDALNHKYNNDGSEGLFYKLYGLIYDKKATDLLSNKVKEYFNEWYDEIMCFINDNIFTLMQKIVDQMSIEINWVDSAEKGEIYFTHYEIDFDEYIRNREEIVKGNDSDVEEINKFTPTDKKISDSESQIVETLDVFFKKLHCKEKMVHKLFDGIKPIINDYFKNNILAVQGKQAEEIRKTILALFKNITLYRLKISDSQFSNNEKNNYFKNAEITYQYESTNEKVEFLNKNGLFDWLIKKIRKTIPYIENKKDDELKKILDCFYDIFFDEQSKIDDIKEKYETLEKQISDNLIKLLNQNFTLRYDISANEYKYYINDTYKSWFDKFFWDDTNENYLKNKSIYDESDLLYYWKDVYFDKNLLHKLSQLFSNTEAEIWSIIENIFYIYLDKWSDKEMCKFLFNVEGKNKSNWKVCVAYALSKLWDVKWTWDDFMCKFDDNEWKEAMTKNNSLINVLNFWLDIIDCKKELNSKEIMELPNDVLANVVRYKREENTTREWWLGDEALSSMLFDIIDGARITDWNMLVKNFNDKEWKTNNSSLIVNFVIAVNSSFEKISGETIENLSENIKDGVKEYMAKMNEE